MAGQVLKAIVKCLTTDTWANLIAKLKKSEIGIVEDGGRAAYNDNGTIVELVDKRDNDVYEFTDDGEYSESTVTLNWRFRRIGDLVYADMTDGTQTLTIDGAAIDHLQWSPPAGASDIYAPTAAVYVPILIAIDSVWEIAVMTITTSLFCIIRRIDASNFPDTKVVELVSTPITYMLDSTHPIA